MKYKVQNIFLICVAIIFLGCNPKQEGLMTAIERKNMAIVNTLLGSGLYSKTEIADAFKSIWESYSLSEDEKREFYGIFRSHGFSINDFPLYEIAKDIVRIHELGIINEVNIKPENSEGRNLFHYLHYYSDPGSSESSLAKWKSVWIELLSNNKELINSKDYAGQTPLIVMFDTMYSSESWEFSVLFLNGADPRIRDQKGLNAIDYCEGKLNQFPNDEYYPQFWQLMKYDYTKEQLDEMLEDYINEGTYSFHNVYDYE